MIISDYTVDPTDANDDLMVAEFVRQDQSQNSKKVNLHFHHALAKVAFKFKTLPNELSTGAKISVKSVTIDGLKVGGTLTVTQTAADDDTPATQAEETTPTDETRAGITLKWDEVATPSGNFVDDYEGDDNPFATEFVNPDNDNSAMVLDGSAEVFTTWLVIPQTITGKKVKVVYVINKRQFEVVFDLTNNNAITKWDVNQSITYTVTLAPNTISFNPTVEDWTVLDETEMSN
ncbi:MAG: fimbrillin family protein [Prevotella sp.]|nr:fimbrillin family protein [Prevotella sp.]